MSEFVACLQPVPPWIQDDFEKIVVFNAKEALRKEPQRQDPAVILQGMSADSAKMQSGRWLYLKPV
jgi:hypothetical protein